MKCTNILLHDFKNLEDNTRCKLCNRTIKAIKEEFIEDYNDYIVKKEIVKSHGEIFKEYLIK